MLLRRRFFLISFFFLTIAILNATWYLSTFSYLNSDKFREKLNGPELSIAYGRLSSPFPGWLWVEGLQLHSREKGLEWKLHFADARLFIKMLPLREEKALFSSIAARGGQLSFHVLPEAKSEPKEKAEAAAESSDPQNDNAWELAFDRIALTDLSDVVIDGYALKGRADVNGSLRFARNGDFSIKGLRIAVTRAEAFLLDKKFAQVQDSSIDFKLDRYNAQTDISQKLDADLRFDAELVDLSPLRRPLASIPWLDLRSADAKAAGRVVFRKGAFASPTDLRLDSDQIRARFLAQEARGAAKLSWKVQDDQPKSIFSLAFEKYGLRRVGKAEDEIQGRGLRFVVSSEEAWRLGKLRDWQAEITMPKTDMKSLAYLNIFLPEGFGLQIDGGRGSMESRIRASSDGDGGGFLRVAAQDIGMSYEKTRVKTDLRSDFHFARVDLENGRFQLKNSELNLEKLSVDTGKKRMTDWRGRLALPDARFHLEDPIEFTGHVTMQAKDLSPLLTLYGSERTLPEWVEEAINLQNVQVDFDAKADPENLSIKNLRAQAEDIKLEGWYQRQAKKPEGKLLLNYGRFEGALGVKGEAMEWKLINARAWFSGR